MQDYFCRYSSLEVDDLILAHGVQFATAGEADGFAAKTGIAVFVVVDIVLVAVDVAEITGFIGDGGDIGIGGELPAGAFAQADLGTFCLIVAIDGSLKATTFTKIQGNFADIVGQDLSFELLILGVKGKVTAIFPLGSPAVAGYLDENISG